jgi:membrane associated rhomboid family serine protease
MELNDLFITLPLISCVWLLVNRPDRAWALKAALLLAVLGCVWLKRPDLAGQIVIGPWALFVMTPLWLQRGSLILLRQRHLRTACVTSTLLCLLHPWSGSRILRRTVFVLRELVQGDVEAGLRLAASSGISDPAIIHLGEVLRLQQSCDWQDFETRMQARSDRGVWDSSLLSGRLLATAHLGQWEEFANLCEAVAGSQSESTSERNTLQHVVFSPEQNTGLQLRAWALLGDLPAVRSLIRASGHLQSHESREFWLAVAEQQSGQVQPGRDRLLAIRRTASPVMRPLIERHLELGPLPGPDPATSGRRAREALQPLRRSIALDSHLAIMTGHGAFPVATLGLMLVLGAVFCLEIPGGSEDTENLERLGALVVPMEDGPWEWTRMLTAGFLHFGPLHLAMNLLGLWFLGRMLEREWGRIGLLLHFLTCLAVSGLLLPWLTWPPDDEAVIFAGASGGVMGLLGGIWGALAIGRFFDPTPRIRNQFRSACVFVGLQSTCDILMPGVSMTCHLLGLATGVLLGLLVGSKSLQEARSSYADSAGLLPN